jgi:nonribosomal peptide synthetase protein VioO
MADHTVLAAYVVPRTSAGLGVDLRDYLRDRVPAHLIPSRIAIVPDLVYTASGKVDRRRTKEIPHER